MFLFGLALSKSLVDFRKSYITVCILNKETKTQPKLECYILHLGCLGCQQGGWNEDYLKTKQNPKKLYPDFLHFFDGCIATPWVEIKWSLRKRCKQVKRMQIKFLVGFFVCFSCFQMCDWIRRKWWPVLDLGWNISCSNTVVNKGKKGTRKVLVSEHWRITRNSGNHFPIFYLCCVILT